MAFDFASYMDGRRDQQHANPPRPAGGSSSAPATSPIENDVLYLKKRLAATRAVRDTLKDALKEVAPDHPLLNPSNDRLSAVGRTAADQITSAADKI